MYTALPRDRRTGTVHVYITMSVSVLFFTFLPKPVNETGKKERVVCTPELCPKDNAVLHRRQVGFLSANARKRSGPYRKHGSNRQRNAVKRALQEYYPPPTPHPPPGTASMDQKNNVTAEPSYRLKPVTRNKDTGACVKMRTCRLPSPFR